MLALVAVLAVGQFAEYQPPSLASRAVESSAARLLQIDADLTTLRDSRTSYAFPIFSIAAGGILVAGITPTLLLFTGLVSAIAVLIPGLVLLGVGIASLVVAGSQNRGLDEQAQSLEQEKQALLARLAVNAQRGF